MALLPSLPLLSAAPAPPNILFILADDLGLGDLGCYGQRRIRTPNIDRMAAGGMRFTQAYSGATVCAPSRCCLMTGVHGGHARIRDNEPHGVMLQPDDPTVAKLLKKAGYATGAFGKWSLGEAGSWGEPNRQGFDQFFGCLDQDLVQNYFPDSVWENDHQFLVKENRGNGRKLYSPDLFLDRAVEFLKSNRHHPFFLYYAPTLPHWSDYPRDSAQSQDVPSDAPYSSEDWPEVERRYAAMVTRLDAQVGRLLDLVASLSIETNTLIFFTSDNGPSAEALHRPAFFSSAGPFRGYKRDLYEGGIRAPLLAQWQGTIAPGSVNPVPCAFWDVLPTAAELAALPKPKCADGLSLVPAFHNRPIGRREYMYWDYGHVRGNFSQAVRVDDWKAVRRGPHGTIELYDLAHDEGERHDVAAAHPEIIRKMAAVMRSAFTPSPDYPIKGL